MAAAFGPGYDLGRMGARLVYDASQADVLVVPRPGIGNPEDPMFFGCRCALALGTWTFG